MIKRRKIELEESNSILDIAIDETGKILFIKKETIEGNISRVRGFGKLISKKDMEFSNLTPPPKTKEFIIQYLYEYNLEDINNSKFGYITLYDNNRNIYSQEHLLYNSSVIVMDKGKEIIKNTIPVIESNIDEELHKIIGNNIKTLNISKKRLKTTKKVK